MFKRHWIYQLWHQDARYNGWDKLLHYNWVTTAGANRSHERKRLYVYVAAKSPMVNVITLIHMLKGQSSLTPALKGQTILGVPEDKLWFQLNFGLDSYRFHHPWVVHGSGSHNTSKKRRVGLAIQSYIGTEVEQQYC